jgi:hypothetical protein
MEKAEPGLSFRNKLAILLGLGLILELHFTHLNYYFFLTDDAFISFRYLQNWIEGHGLVFNPGERVEGYTNFLWIVLLAPFARLQVPPEQVAPVLSTLFSFLTILLIFFFPRLTRQEKEIRPGWLLAPLFLALNRSWAVWATSGLETRFFTFLIFLAAVFAWRTSQNLDRRDPWAAGLCLALAELCRPEAVLFFIVAGGLILGLRLLQGKTIRSRGDWGGLLVFLGVVLVHYLGRHWYYGQWFPNTFYAKVNQPWWNMGFRYLGVFGLEYSCWIWLPLLAAFGLRSFRDRNSLPGFLVLFPLPYLLYVAYLGGDHFEYRFLDPALPFLALLGQECLRRLARSGRVRTRRTLLAVFTLGFLAYSTALPWATGLGFGPAFSPAVDLPLDLNRAPWLKAWPGFQLMAESLRRAYQPLLASMVGHRAEYHRLLCLQLMTGGRLFQNFIRQGRLGADEIICTGAIGAVPYYSRLRTVDFFGLTDPVVAREKPTAGKRILFHEHGASSEYLKGRNVDYVLLGVYLYQAVPDQPPPDRPPHRPDLNHWQDRTYLVQFDAYYLQFQSPQNPSRLEERFQKRGLPIWIYLPNGDKDSPFPLEPALARFPELGSAR